MPLDDAINFLILVCFLAAFIVFLGCASYIIEKIWLKNKRKIQDYFRDNVRWFR